MMRKMIPKIFFKEIFNIFVQRASFFTYGYEGIYQMKGDADNVFTDFVSKNFQHFRTEGIIFYLRLWGGLFSKLLAEGKVLLIVSVVHSHKPDDVVKNSAFILQLVEK